MPNPSPPAFENALPIPVALALRAGPENQFRNTPRQPAFEVGALTRLSAKLRPPTDAVRGLRAGALVVWVVDDGDEAELLAGLCALVDDVQVLTVTEGWLVDAVAGPAVDQLDEAKPVSGNMMKATYALSQLCASKPAEGVTNEFQSLMPQ